MIIIQKFFSNNLNISKIYRINKDFNDIISEIQETGYKLGLLAFGY